MRVTPVCDVHGPMIYQARYHWWVCPGFDGEGCPVQFVTDELVQRCALNRLPNMGVTLRCD